MSSDSGPHILVVDDDEDILRLLSMRLRARGFRVSMANSAEEGLARIAVDPPRAVVSDVRLPGRDGLALFEEIRRTRKQTTVLFDPLTPGNHVLHREFLPGAFKVCLMGLLGLLIFLVGLALIAIGGNLVLTCILPAALQWKPAPPPLIGDPLRDYYSGALDAHAWKKWDGYRCRIFLLPDRTLIVIHDESTHHRAERWSLTEALSGRAGIHFDETQEAARSEFFDLIREEEVGSS